MGKNSVKILASVRIDFRKRKEIRLDVYKRQSIYNVLVSVTNKTFGMRESSTADVSDSLQGKCFLLAEDNAINAEIAETLLKMNGAVVECVDNGKKAVDRFLEVEAGHFDAILMDVQMPVMNGCEATRQIPVSYTHLDVYKRQVLVRPPILAG